MHEMSTGIYIIKITTQSKSMHHKQSDIQCTVNVCVLNYQKSDSKRSVLHYETVFQWPVSRTDRKVTRGQYNVETPPSARLSATPTSQHPINNQRMEPRPRPSVIH